MLEFILAAGLGVTFHCFISSLLRQASTVSTAPRPDTPFLDRRSGLLLLSIIPFLISLSCFLALNPASFLPPSLSSKLTSTFFGLVFGLSLVGYLNKSSYLQVIHATRHNHLIMGGFLLFVAVAGLFHQPLLRMVSQVERFSALGVEVEFRFNPSRSIEDAPPFFEHDRTVSSEQALYLLSQVPSMLERDKEYLGTISKHLQGVERDDNTNTLALFVPETIVDVLHCLTSFRQKGLTVGELGIDVGYILGHHRAWQSSPVTQARGLYLAYSEARSVLRDRGEQYAIFGDISPETREPCQHSAYAAPTIHPLLAHSRPLAKPSNLHMSLIQAYWFALIEKPIEGAHVIDSWIQSNERLSPIWLRIRAQIELTRLLMAGGEVSVSVEESARILELYREMFGIVFPKQNILWLIDYCHAANLPPQTMRLLFSYVNETNNYVVNSTIADEIGRELVEVAKFLSTIQYDCFDLGDAKHFFEGSFNLTFSQLIYRMFLTSSDSRMFSKDERVDLQQSAFGAMDDAIKAFERAEHASLAMWKNMERLETSVVIENIRARTRYAKRLRERLKHVSVD